jgi:predicted transcriptional regulator
MLVLQSCTDPLEVMADSSTGTFPTSSDGTYGVGNIKVEEVEEVNVKTENIIFSEKDECIDIKDEDSMHSEEDEEAEYIDIKEEDDVEIKDEVC